MTAGQPGIFGMCITPFDGAGKLDEGALRAQLRYIAGGGAGVYLASQGTGEGHLLEPEEIRRVYEIGVAELKGKVPVYASGVGFGSTRHVIESTREAASFGVDAVVVMPPAPSRSVKPNAGEVEAYLDEILEAVRTPVFLYNHPMLVNYKVPLAIFERLCAKHGHVAGVHCTDPDLNYLVRLIDSLGARTAVHVGLFGQLMTNLMLGGHGALGYEPNIAPRLCTTTFEAFRSGDWARAIDGFTRLLRLGVVLAKYQNPRAIKAAVNLLGLPGGVPRRPYLPLDTDAVAEIAQVLEALEIRQIEGIA